MKVLAGDEMGLESMRHKEPEVSMSTTYEKGGCILVYKVVSHGIGVWVDILGLNDMAVLDGIEVLDDIEVLDCIEALDGTLVLLGTKVLGGILAYEVHDGDGHYHN